MAVVAGRHQRHDLAVPHNGFVVKHHRIRLGQPELHHAPGHARLSHRQHRIAPDEVALVRLYGKPEARLEDMVLIGDVVPKMPESLFDPAGIEGVESAELQPDLLARLNQRLERMRGLIRADVKLPAEFADIAHPMRPGETHSQLDFTGGSKGVCVIAEVVRTDELHQVPRLGPHDAENGLGHRDVCDDRKIVAHMPPEPRHIPNHCRRRDDQQKRGFGQAGHGQIALDPAPRVQHLRVDETSGGNVDVIGADALEEGAGVAPLDPDLAKGRHIEQPDAFAHSHMVGLVVLEPVLPSPVVAIFCRLPGIGEPVCPLPSGGFTKNRAPRLQVFVDRAPPHPPCRDGLPIGVVIGVEQPERLAHTFAQVTPVALKWLGPADIGLPEIERRRALGDPLGQRHASPARRDDADRVITGRHPVAAQFRCLAQIVSVVRRKALRAIEKRMHTRRLEKRHPVHRLFEDRLEMLEILGQAVELEVFGDAIHAPGLGLGLEGAQHHFPCVFLVIGAFVRNAENGKCAQPLDRFGDKVEMLAGMKGQRDTRLRRQIAAPHSSAVDDYVRLDRSGLAAA